MANTFLRKTASVSNSQATIYTVPVQTTTVVIGFIIANKLASMIDVEIEAAGKKLGVGIPIPAGSSLSVLDGKLVLEAGDTVKVASDTADSADVLLSIMEIA